MENFFSFSPFSPFTHFLKALKTSYLDIKHQSLLLLNVFFQNAQCSTFICSIQSHKKGEIGVPKNSIYINISILIKICIPRIKLKSKTLTVVYFVSGMQSIIPYTKAGNIGNYKNHDLPVRIFYRLLVFQNHNKMPFS